MLMHVTDERGVWPMSGMFGHASGNATKKIGYKWTMRADRTEGSGISKAEEGLKPAAVAATENYEHGVACHCVLESLSTTTIVPRFPLVIRRSSSMKRMSV